MQRLSPIQRLAGPTAKGGGAPRKGSDGEQPNHTARPLKPAGGHYTEGEIDE